MSTNNISFDVIKNKKEKKKEKHREQTFEALEKIEQRLIARDESARRA